MKEQKAKATFYHQGKELTGHVFVIERKVHFIADHNSYCIEWDEYSLNVVKYPDCITIRSALNINEYLTLTDLDFARILQKNLDIKIYSKSSYFLSKNSSLILWIGFISISVVGLIFNILIRTHSKYLASLVSEHQEIEMGRSIFEKNYKNKIVTLPGEHEKNWNSLIATLTNLSKNEDQIWHVYIIDDQVDNAFALPGKYIILNSGFIKQSSSPEEIIGVLAHEMGHILANHPMQKIITDNVMEFANFFVFSSGIANMGDNMTSLVFSREDESKADAIGMDLLNRANISPKGLIDFFEKSSKKDVLSNSKIVGWLSTHPMSMERAAFFKSNLDHSKAYGMIDFPWESFQKYFNENH